MESRAVFSKIIGLAREEAYRTGWDKMMPEHYILGMLRDGKNDGYSLLKMMGMTRDLKSELESYLLRSEERRYEGDASSIDNAEITNDIISLMLRMVNASGKYDYPTTKHFVVAVIKDSTSFFASLARYYGFCYEDLAKEDRIDPERPSAEKEESDGEDFSASGGGEMERREERQGEDVDPIRILNRFGDDITGYAAEGRIEPVVGRENEISRVIHTLLRKKKNNPLIVGFPGVGKRSIVNAVALRIISKKIPFVLVGKRIISIDMNSVVAGTKFRGEFEERMKKILNAAEEIPGIILFFENLHTVVGAGNASGSLDAATIIKPALAKGTVQCIGTTTEDEYRKVIERDPSLNTLFRVVRVDEPNLLETGRILRSVASEYEEYHGVFLEDGVIDACIALSNRYITDRHQPDKAIDLLDEASAMKSRNKMELPEKVKRIKDDMELAMIRKREEVANGNTVLAARYSKLEGNLREEFENHIDKFIFKVTSKSSNVAIQDIYKAVSSITSIPADKIAQSEGNRLLKMQEALRLRIIGQDEAIERVSHAIRRNRAGLRNPGKPIGTFLFLGPTGVGKTHLAKILSEYMFDTKESFIRIDMSEYTEKFSISRLIGAPPGYVGYEEGGQLSERVRRKPYSVVLLDEIEKAHPDLFNLMLQVLDEGRLTDSFGRDVDFRNTIIILTSNIGSRELTEFGNGIGFSLPDKEARIAKERSIIEKALNKTFNPEFINRLDDIVYFHTLSHEDIAKIVKIELKELLNRVKETGYRLTVTKAAIEFLAEAGFDTKYGARPVKRAIQRFVEDPLAEEILSGRAAMGRMSLSPDKERGALEVHYSK